MLAALVVAACLTLCAYWALISDDVWAGRVIYVIGPGHGVHLGDVPLVVAWLLGLAGCGWLARG